MERNNISSLPKYLIKIAVKKQFSKIFANHFLMSLLKDPIQV